jgi:hypothetical protein
MNYRCSGKDETPGYLFTTAILVGLWALKDDHDTLNVGVAAFIILNGIVLPFLRAAALRLALASFNDIMFVSMAVPGQVIHREFMVLTRLVHDLVEFCTASAALFEFVAFLFLGVDHELASTFMILLS